jgi:predicted acetyltransferase
MVRSGVALEVATADRAPVLSNLLELYIHDLSGIFPVELRPDGSFGYARLPLYWSEPDTHFPYFIRRNGRLAGFALVTRGSPATDDPADLDLTEFFVLRSYRRLGVGSLAAELLWNTLGGHWVVRVSTVNGPGLSFWEKTITQYTGGAFSIQNHPVNLPAFLAYSFSTRSV